ncbi:amidohydrolase [Bacterioplanes sanyensis]|uniref:Amidohydrolase n=2 Tax=Bacterioplanes sanyensis TaxID=1249553 RepID=A0A222FJH1_9GAMM|nr:amidohydrolase [Bacterioplanes sanyensis]
MCSIADVEANLAAAHALVADAARQGARLVVVPEMFLTLDGSQFQSLAARSDLVSTLAAWAQDLGIWLVAGAIPLPSPDDDVRLRSACCVFNDQGEQVARYDKIHLFDVDVGDAQGSYQESDRFAPGEQVVVVDTPVGRLGLAICYDLRFAELFQRLADQGAELISLPAAFTHRTGEAHWQSLLRARAIEQQCFILAANQCGWHDDKRQTWGHSQIIDPWGQVLTELGHESGVALADIDLSWQQEVRRRMPVQQHRRLNKP